MKALFMYLLCVVLRVESTILYQNVTYQPVERQLLDFKQEHQKPIGQWTKNAGDPVDIRDTIALNSDQFNNQLLLDTVMNMDSERVPERLVHAKGIGAFGYFEVTNDVSEYTYADVFNGIGKKTPLLARMSISLQNKGGTDFARELRGLAIKFYTRAGILDLLCLQIPIYFYRDTMLIANIIHAFKRNPQTTLFDFTGFWDLVSLHPMIYHGIFWLLADFGIPDGYRRMDAFPIHTYELANKDGETHYVRFNFRTEQGIAFLTSAQAAQIQSQDLDYFNRDLYNAIDQGNFPAWRLEMDVMTAKDIKNVDFDPFDVTRLWTNGTFVTVPIGRLVLNRNVENDFRDVEQAVFNPGHLVPGIPGPVEVLFKGRRVAYRDTQNYRVGRNHLKIPINSPLYAKTYVRDGTPPVGVNMKNAPNYFPNSFNGPAPYVDDKRPWKSLEVLQSNAVDFEPLWYFYNYILEDKAHRQRFRDNLVSALVPVTPPVIQRVLKDLFRINHELGRRVKIAYEVAIAERQAEQAAAQAAPPPGPLRNTPTVQPAKNSQKKSRHHYMYD